MAQDPIYNQSGRLKRILLVVNSEWFFLSHRLPLARALRDMGFEVHVAAPVERNQEQEILSEGFIFHPLRLGRRSLSVSGDLGTLRELYKLYRAIQPALVHHVTIKPVLYGSIAARLAKVPAIVNAISGLGYVFCGKGIRPLVLRFFVTILYRVALLGGRMRIIFQNPSDQAHFIAKGLVREECSALIRGSGVNLSTFLPAPFPEGPPLVVMACRLLWDKGIREYAEAATLLKQRGILARFALIGLPDEGNPASATSEWIEEQQRSGCVELWGLRSDMPAIMRSATIVVLPSYHEGVPKVLLEAAASGRPIVATEIPGCRVVVSQGVNGLLVPPRNAEALSDAMEILLGSGDRLHQMGEAGRKIAEENFSEDQIIAQTLDLYRELLDDVSSY